MCAPPIPATNAATAPSAEEIGTTIEMRPYRRRRARDDRWNCDEDQAKYCGPRERSQFTDQTRSTLREQSGHCPAARRGKPTEDSDQSVASPADSQSIGDP
jgi:hypothetical protein